MIKQDILLTVDNVIFTIVNEKLQVLLIKRLLDPFKDHWALPGGFVLENEDLEKAAYRELEEETGLKKHIYLEQLCTLGEVDRDPRGRVVSVAYMAILERKDLSVKAGSDAKEVKLFPIDRLPKLAFDHKDLIKYAQQRLKWKLEYTNVAQYLIPKKFKFSDLQKVYELVFEKQFDTRNFRKKIEKLGIIEETGEMEIGVKHRPGKLYKFKDRNLQIIDIF